MGNLINGEILQNAINDILDSLGKYNLNSRELRLVIKELDVFVALMEKEATDEAYLQAKIMVKGKS